MTDEERDAVIERYRAKPLPTPYQRELLTILIEEASEVIKVCTKTLRFGIDDFNPHDFKDNRTAFAEELGDFMCLMQLLEQEGFFTNQAVLDRIPVKRKKLFRYMQTEPTNG